MSSAEHSGSPEAGRVVPSRAVVAPRVRIAGETAAVPLEDRITQLLESKTRGLVNLIGPPGSGKTTALQHLSAVLGPDAPLHLIDTRIDPKLQSLAKDFLVLVTSQQAIDSKQYLTLLMTSWTDEDLASYLLVAHPGRCRPVMGRVLADADRDLLCGLPELWRIVLDEMAADDSLASIDSAISNFLNRELARKHEREAAEQHALIALVPLAADGEEPHPPVVPRMDRLLRHHAIRLFLAARQLLKRLRHRTADRYLSMKLPLELMHRVAALATEAPEVLAALDEMTRAANSTLHPAAVSLLHATGIGWRPVAPHVPTLNSARLAGVQWDGIHLAGGKMCQADFSGASLANADLAASLWSGACLAGATLRNASLRGAIFSGANLAKANVGGASADSAGFANADLSDATLSGADLRGANFRNANLCNARFCRAELSGADLVGASLEAVDFTKANFTGARLAGLLLAGCAFDSNRFCQADLAGCNIEGIWGENMDFEDAHLARALLTGSMLPSARFVGANLANCGLAEIDWEGADLRGADLRGSTFHMGTTRSGLVGSSIPCEGSRTRFYTDEYFDTGFKSPEEIRKANLCWADLRGAEIDGVDFYLVDLRHAKYSDEQEQWFRKCGAILCDR